jgi:hypothetical protein
LLVLILQHDFVYVHRCPIVENSTLLDKDAGGLSAGRQRFTTEEKRAPHQTGAELLFEIFSQRHERGSTIVTSNLPFEEWTSVFQSQRLTGALLDRLTHHVHILELNGESYRLKQSKTRRRREAQPADLAAAAADPETGLPHPESHVRPGYETPTISAGADAAHRPLCPRRKLAWFCSAPLAGFYSAIDTGFKKQVGRVPRGLRGTG